MGLLDVIIDPVAFLGDRFFLGKIYGYAEDGAYFHVPFSNQLGWWLVSATTIALVIALDRRFVKSNAGQRAVPFRALVGPGVPRVVEARLPQVPRRAGRRGLRGSLARRRP